MKNFFFSSLNHIFNQKAFYYKMIFFNFLFTSLALFIITFTNWNILEKSLKDIITESDSRLLSRVQLYTDKYVIDEINALISDNFLSDSHLYQFIFNDQSSSSSYLNCFRSLETLVNKNKFLDSIFIYQKSDAIFMSSDYGLKYNALESTKGFDPPNVIPYLLNSATSFTNHYTWITPYQNHQLGYSIPMISFVQAIPLYSNFSNAEGYIILNISHDSFFASLSEIYPASSQLLVLDQNNQLIAHSNTSILLNTNTLEESLLSLTQSTPDGFLEIMLDETTYGVTWLTSPATGWKYLSATPLNILNTKMLYLKNFSFILFTILLVFSFLGIYLISSQLYNPLKKLFATLKASALYPVQATTDLAYISNVVSYLENQVEDMQTTLSENKTILLYKVFLDVLLGKSDSIDDLNSRFALCDIQFLGDQYAILITQLDPTLLAKLTINQQEYLISKVKQLLTELLAKHLLVVSIAYPTHCISTLLNSTHLNISKLLSTLEQVSSVISTQLSIQLNLSISQPCSSLLEIPSQFSATQNNLKYSYIYGYGRLFTPEQIQHFEENTPSFSLSELQIMEGLLHTSKDTELKEFISSYVCSIREKGYSYDYTQSFLLYVVSMLIRNCEKQNVFSNSETKRALLLDFQEISDLTQSIYWIHSIIDSYISAIPEATNTAAQILITQVCDYICNTPDAYLTLSDIASYFEVSPSHLSRTFREIMGINFSDYIIDKKLEKAAQLILTEKHCNISELAKSLGYLTPSYFSKIFKEKYGMTPGAYRKKHFLD